MRIGISRFSSLFLSILRLNTASDLHKPKQSSHTPFHSKTPPMRIANTIFITLLLIATVITGGCSESVVKKDGIYICDDFEIYTDSIVRRGDIHKATSATEITGIWQLTDTASTLLSTPILRTDSHIINALFTKAESERHDTLSPLEIYLSAGLLQPDDAMKSLRETANRPTPDNENYPHSTLTPYWAEAAWEVYCATGSQKWLSEAFGLLQKMLQRQQQLNSSPLLPDLVIGIHDTTHSAATTAVSSPQWLNGMEQFQSFSTTANILRANALYIASRMAGELNNTKKQRSFKDDATRLRNAINDRLWHPDRQFYGQRLYGSICPIADLITDNEANSLAILTGTATREMSDAIIANIPLPKYGVSTTHPVPDGDNSRLSPEVQTLFALASAKVRNAEAFTLATASLMNLSLDHRLPSLLPAIILKGMFGISATTTGLTFSPMIPDKFPGGKHLEGLRYRNAVIDITLNGTGDRIASFMLDSVSFPSPEINGNISGHHRVTITLSGNNISSHRRLNIVDRPATILPTPKVDRTSATELRIANFDDDTRYAVYINGIVNEEITSPDHRIDLPDENATTIVNIVPHRKTSAKASATDASAGYSSKPIIVYPKSSLLTVRASTIIPRRPPRHFIKDPATASNYIELAARHNTRITCYVNAPDDGDYYLTVGYANGFDRCAIRRLDINDRYASTLLLPPVNPNDWISVNPSTTASVSLQKGVNKIALTYVKGTILFHHINLLKQP